MTEETKQKAEIIITIVFVVNVIHKTGLRRPVVKFDFFPGSLMQLC